MLRFRILNYLSCTFYKRLIKYRSVIKKNVKAWNACYTEQLSKVNLTSNKSYLELILKYTTEEHYTSGQCSTGKQAWNGGYRGRRGVEHVNIQLNTAVFLRLRNIHLINGTMDNLCTGSLLIIQSLYSNKEVRSGLRIRCIISAAFRWSKKYLDYTNLTCNHPRWSFRMKNEPRSI